MQSLVATRPSPVEPLREGSEKSRRIDYLVEEEPEASKRERAATVRLPRRQEDAPLAQPHSQTLQQPRLRAWAGRVSIGLRLMPGRQVVGG